jgi:hypothetical protein
VVRGRERGLGVGFRLAAAALLLGAAACASPADGPLGDEREARDGADADAHEVSTTNELAADATDAPTTVPPDAPRYTIGTCVDWDPATATDPARPGGFGVVACEQPHRGETVGPTAGSDTPGHLYPSSDALVALAAQSCTRQAQKYLGEELDDEGRFVVVAMPPSHDLWERGYRTLECVLASRSDAPSQLLTGSSRGAPQWWTFVPGDCVAYQPEVTEPMTLVPCDQPHRLEIAGSVVLDDPHYDLTSDEAIETCFDIATDYLGHFPDPPWFAPMTGARPSDWASGDHTAYCALVQFDESDGVAVVSSPAP